MGYNVTPRGDGSFHVTPDGPGCGCFLSIFFLVGGTAGLLYNKDPYNIAFGVLCLLIGFFFLYKSLK